ADPLAVVEHRGLVLFALADDHDPVDVEGGEVEAHAVDGGLVDGLLVATAQPAGGAEGCGLGDPDQVETEVPLDRLGHQPTSTMIASPWPPPPQRAAAPMPPPRAMRALMRVTTMRAPVAPSGWPRATAPPWTFTFSGGMSR